MNETIIAFLAYLTQSLGSLGSAIVVLSLGIRVALLPMTVKLARRARRHQELMQGLQPEIAALRKRFEKKPDRFFAELQALYRKHNCQPLDFPALLANLSQLPIFCLLYNSIRASLNSTAFLWIKDLARPDFVLTAGILVLTGLSVALMPATSDQARNLLIAVQVAVTFFIVWKLAAGLSLYWASSTAVTLVQTLWLRRFESRAVAKP